jgi:hypothetical protein
MLYITGRIDHEYHFQQVIQYYLLSNNTAKSSDTRFFLVWSIECQSLETVLL